MHVLFFIGRIVVGLFYIYNGLNHFLRFSSMAEYAKFKGVPLPEVAVAISGILLLIGGLTILPGTFPEIGVAALVLFLLPVTFMMHNFWAMAGDQKMGEMINFTKNLALLGSALMFLAIRKPWPMSIAGKKKKMT